MHGEKRESETESKSCLFIEILLGRDMFGPTSNMGQCNISSIIMSIVMILTMLERCNRSDQQEEFLAPQGALHANFFRFSLGPAPVSQQICIYSIWSSWRNHLQSMPMYQNRIGITVSMKDLWTEGFCSSGWDAIGFDGAVEGHVAGV